MKKNIDPQTAKLFEAVKKEYFFQYSDILKSETCANVTVDQIIALLSGKWIDGLTFAEGVVVPYCYKTDMKVEGKTVEWRCGLLGSVVRLIDGYTCSVESLPRIYKQLARLAGEKVETIAVGPRPMLAYGLTDAALKDKKNKKILAVLKKYCVADDMRIFPGYVYHDDRRRCAVWSDGHILLVSPALYNPEAAGQMYDKNGQPVKGDNYKFPNYPAVVPDYTTCFSFDAATVARNMASVLPFVPKSKYSTPTMIIANVDGVAAGVNPNFKPVFDCMPGRVYTNGHATPYIAPLGDSAADGFILVMPMYTEADGPIKNVLYEDIEADIKVCGVVPDAEADSLPAILPPVVDGAAEVAPVDETPAADAAEVAADPVADVETVAEVVEVDTPAEVVADATPDKKNLTPGTIIDYPEFDYKASGIIISGPIYKENIDSWQYIAIKEYGTMSTVNADNITAIYPCQDADTAAEMVEYAKQQRVACMRRVKKTWSENLINYINIIEDYEAAQDAAADAATPEPTDETPAAPTLTDADVLATAARIKSLYDTMTAEAVPLPSDMPESDPTPLYTAADVEAMIEAATADTYTADEVAAMVADAVAQERARHRRRPAPRLRPVLRRLGRVAAVVLPLLIVALFIGASTASTPAADAAAFTTCQAAETVAQVVELPAVTVTASSLTDAPATPSPVKKLAAPSPVKNAAADAVTLPGQKTTDDMATATAPAADDADSLTTAPSAPMAPAADADGLTICEGTAWAYTMMNWA